jgi:hypothetical protein
LISHGLRLNRLRAIVRRLKAPRVALRYDAGRAGDPPWCDDCQIPPEGTEPRRRAAAAASQVLSRPAVPVRRDFR